MASRGSRDQFPGTDQLPFDTESAHRLSCELGEYLTTHTPTEHLASARDDAGRSVTVYALTEHSCVVELRSPVGHRHFFELPRTAIRATIDRMQGGRWHELDSGA